jgi:CRP/FNR family transcriptional regulator
MESDKTRAEELETLPDGLKEIADFKRFRKGEMLFAAQDQVKGFYYVKAGRIRVYKMDEQGREAEVVRLGPGGFLGEAVVFASASYPVFAQAVTDSEVLYFAKEKINKALSQNPALSLYFVRLLASKCVVLSDKVEMLGLRTVRQRLIQYLLSHCSGDRHCMVDLKVKKGELAKILGTISETLSRNLKHMQDESLIEVRGNRVIIKNCPALREELLEI